MSRSFGERSLTVSPPIFTSPLEMSSSPAIIRSAVDLPQPEGPTRIMNSPSLMSRSMSLTASKPSAKVLVTPSRTISDIGGLLSLDGAGGEPGDDSALEDEYEDDDRHRHHNRGGGDAAGRCGEGRFAGEEGEGGGNGPRGVRAGQRDREEEVVPAEDEDEDRGGEDARRRQRHDHFGEGLERRRPVDLGRLLELPGDLPEEGDEDVDRQRQREGEVGDDQAEPGVVEPERPPHVEERADGGDRREHRDRQRPGEDQPLAGEFEAGDRVGA